ncbi:MAG: hypothetical protein DMG11_10525 [Acidobacteria bacterium]|nr:MAG: hypothetical protein DMG11_10525 [Acidobacteriota bacterium]
MQYKQARESQVAIGHLPEPAAVPVEIQIVIPHRSPRLTKAALKYASTFADGLNVRLRLIDVHVVPYGVPLDEPTVDPKYLARRLRSLAQESTIPVSAELVYARDWEQGFRRALGPVSVVLIAIKRSWWRSSEKRLAARLRKLGHQVIWVEC